MIKTNPDTALMRLTSFSRSFSCSAQINRCLSLSLLIFVLLLSSCATNVERNNNLNLPKFEEERVVAPYVAPTAPWEIWEIADAKVKSDFERTDKSNFQIQLEQGIELEKSGELTEALNLYKQAESEGKTTPELVTRRLGVLLKLGRSYEVLSELSKYSQNSSSLRGQRQISLPPILALLAGFAYQHRDDRDQALAWYSMAGRSEASPDFFVKNRFVSNRASIEIRKILNETLAKDFPLLAEKWKSDPYIGPFVSEESTRRDRGGLSQKGFSPNWYDASTYENLRELNTDFSEMSDSGGVTELGSLDPVYREQINIGLLLPLTGRYAAHAERVRKGIELALREYTDPSEVRLIVKDHLW